MTPATDQPTQDTTSNDSDGVSLTTKIIVGIIFIIMMVVNPTPEKIIGLLIGMALGFIWFGPACAERAGEYNRNPNWAFVIGGVFLLIGYAAYWIYTKIVGVKK